MLRQIDIARYEVEHRLADETYAVLASISANNGGSLDFEASTADLPPGRSEIRLIAVSETGGRRVLLEDEVFVVPGTHVISAPYPNPATESVRVALVVSDVQRVVVEVFDALGRRQAFAHDGWVEPDSELSLDLSVAAWPAGRYWVRVQGTTFSENRMIVVGR
jgi:hypothetical protein